MLFAELICGPPTSANFPPVSTTPAVLVGKFTVSLILRISLGIFEKNRNGPNFILRGLGKDDS
jgi:hypothetical protein